AGWVFWLAKHRADRFTVADPAHGLGQQAGNIELANTRALLRCGAQRNGIGHDQFVERRGIDIVDGVAGQHRVGAIGDDLLGAVFFQRLRRLAQRAGGIDHVVDQDAGAILDFADDVHDLSDIGGGPALVDDGEIGIVELLGDGASAHYAADVGRHDHQVLVALAFNVIEQYRRAVDVVDGHIEKALNLLGVEIDGKYAVDT